MNCVVPENSHTLPTEGNDNSEGRGVQKVAISDGGGMVFRGLFPAAPSKVGCCFLFCFFCFSTNSCLLGHTIRYFTVNRCFKTRILVFIVDPLISVG